MREAPLEDLLAEAVKAENGLYLKMNAALYKGIPDRLLLLPERRIQFVELKADDGRPSVHQINFRETLLSLGFPSVIIKGKAHLQEFISHYVESKL